MASRTLEGLLAGAREHADMEGSSFVSTPHLTRFINSAAARLRRQLIHMLGGDYSRSSAIFSTTAGVDTVDLTGLSIFRLDGVDVRVGTSSRWREITKFNFKDRNDLQRAQGWSDHRVRYRIENAMESVARLRFIPTPAGAHEVRVWYLPDHTPLVEPTDVYTLPADYFEIVELRAALTARTKGVLDTRGLIADLRHAEEEMGITASEISQDEPETIHDARPWDDYDNYGLGHYGDLDDGRWW